MKHDEAWLNMNAEEYAPRGNYHDSLMEVDCSDKCREYLNHLTRIRPMSDIPDKHQWVNIFHEDGCIVAWCWVEYDDGVWPPRTDRTAPYIGWKPVL